MSMFRIVIAMSALYAAVTERAHEDTETRSVEGNREPDERELPTQISALFSCDADNEELSSCANTMFADADHAETCWADEARQDCDEDSQGAYDLVMLEGNSYCTYKALFKLGTFKGVACRKVPGEAADGEIQQKLASEEQKEWLKQYVDEQIKAEKRKDQVKGHIAKKIQEKVDARQQQVKDYMRDQIQKKLGGGGEGEDADAEANSGGPEGPEPGEAADGETQQELAGEGQEERRDQVKAYIADKIREKVDARQQQVKDYMRDQIQKKLGGGGEGEDADAEAGSGDPEDVELGEAADGETQQKLAGEEQEERRDQVKEYIANKIQEKVDARQQQVKDYMRDQIKKKLSDGGEGEDADTEGYSGDPEDLEGGDMSTIDQLDKDLAEMNELHDHDEMMRQELESLDLMDETVVEELGKYSENLAKCMFRCIHSAHRYFSAEEAAREACECTKTSGTELCDECQYLPDDKIKDEEGNPIEVESAHAKGHLSGTHFQGNSSRGRCVLPGEVGEARKINFRGTVIQC